ncbi:hypothetical protein SAY87_015077 [Trapa incisa]|uniref:CBF1-interacting co-repressor CIR N-terminal domain-containing protein n=1 Tax=Trapa incisa TaxID=236973 RepID=A0AAN7JDT5_9MYRT|nr:hypothetical protein SAY87_015077 [Trapa incisa]
MALKFLNKKGWHTGSLQNIENVWKSEQKHEAEELDKHIHEERERDKRQERLEFLYDSGLAVGKGKSEGSWNSLRADFGRVSALCLYTDRCSPETVFVVEKKDKHGNKKEEKRKKHPHKD